ncbi:MAG: L-histidine N(alpha)-methyltransferase [Deltaproteobacteria bacterium]|nr:L-histidine N(alpha)-methyltransferase [Deltaproteobacteria bacterium]
MSAVARALAPDDDVLAGLRASPKRLPCRLLYDATGAELFEQITGVDDYYPTRIEYRLLDEILPSVAEDMGAAARVIEPGAGAGCKTRRLLRALYAPASYVGIDVSREILEQTHRTLARELPTVDVQTVCADFTRPYKLPAPRRSIGKTLAFFPGSTIGNFEPFDAVMFLSGLAHMAGHNGRLLLGADGTHDPEALVRAYDDSDGVTAQFNLNVLDHLNRTRGARFDLAMFRHRAVWNERHSRVEMHLVSQREQTVDVGGAVIHLGQGEPIVTEHCYKHSVQAMRSMLHAAGWEARQVLTGTEQPMRLWWCAPLVRPVQTRTGL